MNRILLNLYKNEKIIENLCYIYKYTQTYNLFKKIKNKNFCHLFQKILALKVLVHMCNRVKTGLNVLKKNN
jgi:hypothetical protein